MPPQAYSHSRLTTLDDCPRRYRFRYVQKLPEAFQTAEAYLGTRVHDALQWLYLEREAGRTPTEEQLVERYREAWRDRLTPSVRVVQEGGSLAKFLAEGEDMVRRHYRGPFQEDRLETLAIEPRIALSLRPPEGDEAAYVGYIDRLARDRAGTMHVIDYKTSKRMPDDIEAAGLQVRAYGLAVLEQHGGTEVELRYEYLRHERHLGETFPLAKGAEVAAALAVRVQRARHAEAADAFPARPSALCRWCGYRESCEASPFAVAARGEAQALAPAPPEADAPSVPDVPPACPLCGSGLRRRVSSRSSLLACERYPDCLHAREL